ncbi:sulfatase [Candidatus Hydrogenedentota bacterium]
MRRSCIWFSLILFFVFAVLLFGLAQSAAAEAKRPHVLLIICDQMHPKAMGNAGWPIKTPALDKLASEGTRFANAYCAAPICSPSRYSMLTGKYPSETGVLTNGIAPHPDLPYLTNMLRDAGYQTATVGKLHHTPGTETHGFEFVRNHEFYMSTGGFSDYGSWLNQALATRPEVKRRPLDMMKNLNGKHWGFIPEETVGVNWAPDDLTPEAWTTDEVLKYFREHKDEAQPIFMHASYFPPHHPYGPIQKYLDMYKQEDMPTPEGWEKFKNTQGHFSGWTLDDFKMVKRYYFAFMTQMDVQIGRLLDGLKDMGVEDNLMVIFTADHGDMLGEHGMLYKGHAYEGSAGVPLIIKYPGVYPAGKIHETPVSHIDFAPTILELAGGRMRSGLRGEDLTPIARNEVDRSDRVVFSMDLRHLPYRLILARKGDFKLVNYGRENKVEFFNLKTDPNELDNLYPKCEKTPEYLGLKTALDEMWARESKWMPEKMPKQGEQWFAPAPIEFGKRKGPREKR